MKRIILILPLLFTLTAFSQNMVQQVSNINLVQTNANPPMQVFASNYRLSDNNTNKPARANANPTAYIQRAATATSNQRRQVRRVSNTVSNVNQPLVNISDNNVNDDIQLQGNFNQQDINAGNAFGNESLIEQIASVNIPAIQVGSGSFDLNLELPAIKLPAIKLTTRKSVSGAKHKSHTVKKKLAKLNRKMNGKLAFGKKLKIKVDNCFKW